MKKISTTLLAAVLLLSIVATPIQAQNDAAKAEADNAPAAKSEDQAVTPQRDDNPQVRIDGTGVHIGGENPVDINVPHMGRRTDLLHRLLPIISVLAVFGMPVAIVGLALFFVHRRNRLLHETLRTMVEKGVPIPPELISGRGASPVNVAAVESRGNKDLRAGLILIAVGIGVLMLGGMAGFSRLGLIPLFIGVALLVVWLIGLIANKRKNTLAQ